MTVTSFSHGTAWHSPPESRRAGSSAQTAAGDRRVSPKAKTNPSSTMRENFESLVWAVGLMMIVRIFILQAFRIPSESMRDTLLVGDFLFITKLDYGAKIPFTHIRLPGLRHPR